MKRLRRCRTFLGWFMAFLTLGWLPGQTASGTTGTWILNNNGNWTGAPANWLDSLVPNGAGDIAVFRNDLTADRSVTLNSALTLGGLQVGDALGGSVFTFAGTSSLTFDNGGASHAFFRQYNGATNLWQAPLVLAEDLDWDIFAGILRVSGASNAQVSYTGGGTTVKNGAGTLQLNIDASSGAGYSGDWVVNLGSLYIGGPNSANPSSLGSGTGGITLNGSGNSSLAILYLANNGTGSDTSVNWAGNNDVTLQGAARIAVERNFVNGANDRVSHVLDNLTLNGGILSVTSNNSHRLTFGGTTSLLGQTSVFDVGTNSTASLATLTLSGVIQEGSASRALIKEGAGRMAITNSGNTYTGATAVKNGVLTLESNAFPGTGATYVNGGALSVPDMTTLDAVSTNGLHLVGQLGTSRFALPAIAYSGSTDIDSSNPLSVNVPVAGMVLAVDGVTGTSSINTANIDLSQAGGGSNRVWLGNLTGADRTYRGTLTNGASGDLRLLAGSNTLILDTNANILGGPSATNNLVFGYDFANPIGITGNYIGQATALLSGTSAGNGSVSVRVDNANTLGSVTVNRHVTLNINGNVTTPVGTGTVTALGGTISTDNASAAQFGNTDFRLFSTSTLLLDNAGVSSANTNRRLQAGTNIDLTTSTFRLIGDGGAATASSQTVASIDYSGGSTLSIDTDGTASGRLATLTVGSLNRTSRGTLNLRSISGNATTFGTSAGTQKLIVSSPPTVTNGMIGAYIALWGGTNSNDATQPLFATYDSTHGVQAAGFTLSNTLSGATTATIAGFSDLAYSGAGASIQALRIRSTASSHTFNASSAVTLGASAAAGQGAGLFLAHTADTTVTHSTNFNFGSQEGLIYTSTSGSNSIVALTGVLSGTNGLTLFGDGRLRLQGNNTFTGGLTVNAGEIRLNAVQAGGVFTNPTNTVDLWGGALYLESSSGRFNHHLTIRNDARFGNVNVSGSGFNNLTVAARTGSAAPVVAYVQNQSGGNYTTAFGSLTLDGPAQFSVVHPLQINGAISGTGSIEKFMNERLVFGADSSGYSQPITVYAGSLFSINSSSTAKPFGTGTVTIQPGGTVQLAAAGNVAPGQLTLNSDLGGISGLALTYNGDPGAVSATIQSTAPWKGFLGVAAPAFSYNLDQSSSGLWGGGAYLGAPLGATGTYIGTVTPTAAGEFLLGTGQGAIRIARPLTGAHSAVIGVSMTGYNRADQVVNNSGGAVNYDVPMSYTGTTTIHPNISLRIAARNALSGTGDIILNGGLLRAIDVQGQTRTLAPVSITNDIVMTADSTIQMDDSANDFRIAGNIQLAPGSTGVVRTLTVNTGQRGNAVNNAGILYLDGGISDGTGGSGNHFVKTGNGTLIVSGPMTYTGSTTVSGGFLAINTDADLASSSQILLATGGLAIWENSFTTHRNYTTTTGNGWFDVAGGLTLTQSSGSTIDGGNFIMKRGLGTMVLNGSNAQTGLWTGDGMLQVNSQAALGNPSEAGASAIQFGGDFNIGADNNTRYTGGTLRLNFSGATNRGVQFNNNSNTNFGGGLDVTAGNAFTINGVISQQSDYDYGFKTGPGTLITNAANTWRQFAMTNGILQFGNSTPWANSTTTSSENTVVEMLGGTLRAVNFAANIALSNQASTTTYQYGGGMHLRLASGAGFSAELSADHLLRVNQGTLVLETEGSTVLGGAGNTNAGRLLTVNAINSGVARASALNNGIFAGHLIGADPAGSGFFLQDDASTGFKAYTGATVNSFSGLAPAAIGNIPAPQVLAGTHSIYAFATTAGISGGTLRVGAIDNLKSGGVILNGSVEVSSNLVFDPTSATAPGTGTPAEALVYVKTGETATLSGTVTANALTKFGDGTLVLSGTSNLIAGDVSVQDGTLSLGGGNPFSRLNSELNLNAGGALDLNGTSVAVETLGANNRAVATTEQVGGQVTNASATPATLTMAGPASSAYSGTLNGNLKLEKAGTGVLTINGFSASTPDAGRNTFTGETDVYGVGTTGGINLNNAPFGLGGFGTSTQPVVNLYGGTLGLLYSNGNAGVNSTHGIQFNNQTVRFGADDGLGMTVNLLGPAQIHVNQGAPNSNSAFGQGNLMQIGALNMSNNTLALSGGNLYRLKVAGTTTIQGYQATFQTNSDSTSIQLDGQVTGAGSVNKLGDGTLRTLILTSPANDFSGGLYVQAGDVQNPNPSANTLGSGPVTVFPEGTLRLAGNGSVNGSNLRTLSRVNAMAAVALDDNFDPTVLNSTNFTSVYHTTLQLAQPYFNQALDLATIGDGRAFLGNAINTEVRYLAATLGAGAPDAWNPGAGVYRLVGGVNNLGFDGVSNVLTGNNYLQIGPQRNMVLGAVGNSGNSVVIRTSNDFTGGTQIAEGTNLYSEVGGSPVGETALGSGAVEIYGTYIIQGSLGSNWKADANSGAGAATNAIVLRPGGTMRLVDNNIYGSGGNLVAGGHGRWGDSEGIDLNGGTFRYDGASNWNSVETIGDVTVRKGGVLQVLRGTASSSAQLNVGNIDRIDRGTLTVTYNSGFLGSNLSTPQSYERLTASQIEGAAITRSGTTSQGAGVTHGGILPVWIIDGTANTFLGYDPTGTGTGMQPLVSSASPGAGEISYNKIVSGSLTAGGLAAGDIADITTSSKTLADNPSVYALRSNQNLSPTGTNHTLSILSGGWIFNGTSTINPTGTLTTGQVSPMTVNFGSGGSGEAILYTASSTTTTMQAQMVAAQGLTKSGSGQLNIHSSNPGIDGPVTLNAGTLYARVPFSGSGTPLAAGGGPFGGQDVILNGGSLQLDPFLANASGTAAEIANNVRATALFNSPIFVRGDATLGNNGQANYVRIPSLTFENAGGATAMNGNGVIALALQSGVWIDGTTTLIPQAVFNSTFNGLAQSTFAGQITENGVSDLEKFGNGALTLLNGTNSYSGGTTIWGTTNNTAVSLVASAFRGTGTPFGSGTVSVNPGGLVRIASNANIASNVVNLKSDGLSLAGLGLAHNGALPTVTTGAAAPGQVHIESSGPQAGVLTLDYGFYSQPLDMAAIPGGNWWLGNSTQADAYYFNGSLGTAANNQYLLGGGGNQSGISFGAVLVSGTRYALFEDLFTGGSAGSTRIQVGALTADDLAANGPSFVNGNSGYMALVARNPGLTGDTRVNTNTNLALGNNFALGSGRLVLNGGGLRYDFGPNNFVTSNITIDNDAVLLADFSTTSSNELVLNGNVSMHDGAAGGTRIWNLGGSGVMAVGLTSASTTHGVISGNEGSNLIKRGAQVVSFRGANTYQGSTQIDRGEIVLVGNVAPGTAGPLGISTSPIVLGVESTNNAGSLGIGGKFHVSRDLLVTVAPGTGLNLIQARTNETAVISGGISVAPGATVTLGGLSHTNSLGIGGTLLITGPISGAGAVAFGTSSTAPNANGPVSLMALSNGFNTNTYSGGTTFNSTRVEIGGDTFYGGPATTPTILSGPFGTGSLTLTSGEGGNGVTFLAAGGPRTIVNAFNATSSAANATWKFAGSQALTFTRNWDVNSDGTLRTRTFQVINPYQPVTFSGNLSASGTNGASLVKSGVGMLILSGSNTFATSSSTGVQIDDGILRIAGDSALGAAGHVRLNGGNLSVSSGFSTSRTFLLQKESGVDVASGQTLTLTNPTSGAFGLRKYGPGTLALNSSTNTINALTLGGAQQLPAETGFFSHTGGTVSTTATSGTPFSTGTVTLHGGTLSLIGGGTAQALSVPTLNYGAAASIALHAGSTSSTLTLASAFNRQGAFNSVNYGTLTLNPSSLANLGVSEKILVSTGAPANTNLTGGYILTVPSVFIALSGSGKDANFARYDATTGFREHDVATVTTLAAPAASNVGEVSSPDVAGPGGIDIGALRLSADVSPTDGTTLIRIHNGGLILNGSDGPVLSANTLFGTGTGSGLKEALVYVRDGQSAASQISSSVSAADFTKTGPGTLELSGSGNTLNSNATRLPVVSVQNGVLRFASTDSPFSNANRPVAVNSALGSYVLNVNENGTFDLNGLNTDVAGLTGNGTVTSSVAGGGTISFKARNGTGVDTTFSGRIADGAGTVSFTKTGNGVLILNGSSSHTGGTLVQAGRVTSGAGTTASQGRLEAQTVSALGAGSVTLQGGMLRFNPATLLDGTQTANEVVDGVESLLFGGPNGYDIVVDSTAYTNGVAIANTTSTLNGTANVASALVNSLTVNAPMLTTTEGNVLVRGQATFAQSNTVLRTAGGNLFLQGQVNAAGNTLTKTGSSTLVLSHTESGANQNSAGLWKISGGLLNARSADGAANPLGASPTVEVNPGSTSYGLVLNTDGDGTAAAERVTTYADTHVRFGSPLPVSSSQFVSSGAGRLGVDRILSNNDDKTVEINSVDVRGALGNTFAYFISSNSDSIWVNGSTTFERDMHFQADGTAVTFNGAISGNGTLSRRTNGATVYLNAENTYNGGTFLTGSGRVLFGSYEGNQVTLSNSAKLGYGHVFLGPLSTLQINDAGNLRAGQNLYVSSNLSWPATLSLASNLSLDQVRFRALGLGGIQNSATDFYLKATNPSNGVLSLGTVYTQTIDQRTLGDGMWFLGSTTNHVGTSGSYDAATLRPGLADTYRLGAGGSTLFFGSNGNANILQDFNGTPSHLLVGAPMTVQNAAAWTTGTVVLLQNQIYTGSTTVNRGSTLDFRGTLTTSGMEVYGTVNAAGEAGTFLHPGSGSNIPVTLRPGSLLRLDNASAGALPLSATQGRWEDSVALALNDSVLRLQGNAAVEIVETVGAITAGNGANRLEVVRGVAGRGIELRTPSLSRIGNGTLQLIHNSDQLGTDERIFVTAAPTVSNGMVEPWIISNSNLEFATYNPDTGFTKAGFTRIQAAGTLSSTVTASSDRTLFSGAVVLNSGVDFNTYALRLDGDVTLGTAADSTAQLIIGSGGLISNSTRTVNSGIVAGSIASPGELLLFNNGTTVVGDLANPNTSGQLVATGVTKFGSGTLQLFSNQPGFSGDLRLQQGALTLDYRNAADVSAVNVTTTIGGSGGNVVFQGAGATLNLRAGRDGTGTNFTGTTVSFNKGITLADYLPVAYVNVDRSAGSSTSGKTVILDGGLTFGQSNGDVGQVLRLDMRNSFSLAIHGTTTLNGRSSLAVEDAAYANTPSSTVYLRGQVTGNGMLIKGPADSKTRTLELGYLNGLNNPTGGTVLQGGTLRVLARATNVAANATTNLVAGGLGSGDITLLQGTLDLRLDGAVSGAADTDLEFVRYSSSGPGPNLFVNGSSTINLDRNFYSGTYSKSGTTVTAVLPGGHGFTNGQSINVTAGSNGTTATSYTLTGVSGNTVTFTDSTGTGTSGNFVVNNNSGSTKMVGLNNLTIGSQILTLSGGNSYGLLFEGSTTLLGNTVINNGLDLVLSGSVATDGGSVILNKTGTGTLWVNSTNNGLKASVYVNAGLLDFGNRAAANTSATLGVSNIFVNPGAQIRVRGSGNINTALGQQVVLTGTPYAPAVFRAAASFNQTQYQNLLASGSSGSNQVAILALEANTSNALAFSSIGNGRLFLGANGDRTYSAASLAPGLANLPNSVVGGNSANPVHRFTHTSSNTLTINLSSGGLADLDGSTPTDVQVGNQAILGPNGNLGSTGFVYFQDQNTYTGQTVVARSTTLRFNTAPNAGGSAGPLGANGAALIDVYGGLRIESNGSMLNTAGTANFYTNLRLHPVSNLSFQDMSATSPNNNRWLDAAPISLDGSAVTADATNNLDNGAETVGPISFDRGSRVYLTSEGTGDAFFTAASVTRASSSSGAGSGRGTLVFVPSNTAVFGAAASASVAQQQMLFTSAPATVTSSVSGMLPGFFMDGNGHRFVKLGANGVTPVADGEMTAFTAGMTAGTAVVNLTGNATLPDFAPVIFALRGRDTLNSPTGANNDATITLAGSGADVGAVISHAAFTINPNLKFGASGTNEAFFYAGGTLTVNGFLTAGGITKFGTGGTMIVSNDQSDAARGTGNGYSNGWVVNEGNLQLGQFGSAGNAVPSNTIVLNGAQAGSAQLNLRAQPADTLLNYAYTSGKIYAVDFATIDWDAGASDRVHGIADLEIQQSGGIGNAPSNGTVDAYLRVAVANSRSILSAGSLTVASHAILNVDATATVANQAATSNNAANLTNSIQSGLSVDSIIGSNRLTKWGDGTLYVRGASPSFTGPLVIDQGAVFVTGNGSLGTGPLTINRYGTLEVGVANYQPTNSSVTYQEGSIERWSVDNARSGTLNLGKATLQVAANQPTTSVNITLDGGGIQAYTNADGNTNAQYQGGVLRILNPHVNFLLAGNSFIGDRSYEGTNGLDSGKQTHDNKPTEEYLASGAILEIQGAISGIGGLTKTGTDTVILSGTNTYAGSTTITSGKVMIGADDALPTSTTLATTANGVLDLNGQNQTVGVLTNVVDSTGANSTSGFVTNSGTTLKTLTVGNGAVSDYSYGGVIQHNLSLTKTGANGSDLTLTNANTYLGDTAIHGGKIVYGTNNALPVTTNVTVNAHTAGGAAALDLNNQNGSIGSLTFGGPGGTSTSASHVETGTGTLTLGGNVTFDATGNPLGSTLSGHLDLGSASRTFAIGDSTTAPEDLSITATISGATRSVTKTGAGTLELTGDNTYSGGTTVNEGILLVDNTSGSGTGTGTVTVAGGTLGGTGSLAGAATVQGGATLRPGKSAGDISQTLTFTSLTMDLGSTWLVDLTFGPANDVADQVTVLTVNGLSISGALEIVSNGGTFMRGTSYVIANYTGLLGGSGGFTNAPQGSEFELAGQKWMIDYNHAGSSIQLTAVPEPETWLPLALILAFGLCFRRRRAQLVPSANPD